MSESTNVGTIVANLKIDSSDWNRELAQAETRAHSLGRANPKIRVETAGTKQAVAELAAVEVAEKKVSASSAALSRMREQGRTVAIAQALADKESIKPKMDFTEWTKRSTEATKQDTAAKEKTSESNRKVDSTAKQAGGSIRPHRRGSRRRRRSPRRARRSRCPRRRWRQEGHGRRNPDREPLRIGYCTAQKAL